jgi:large subunit ribosomal protein L3
MVSAILGKKLGMTQIFEANGDVVPVTVLKTGPCIVIQRKTAARDGYEAAQIGLVEVPPPRRVTSAREGHFKKTGAGATPTRLLREVRLGADAGEVNVGDKVLVDQFSVDDVVDVIGISKGRGFAGFHKRHHFGGGIGSHGSMFHRLPGSIGASAFPSRVLKGMLGAGHMGVDRVTIRNLRVVKVMPDENALVVQGAVPGPNGGYVMVRRAKAPHKRAAVQQPAAEVKKKK